MARRQIHSVLLAVWFATANAAFSMPDIKKDEAATTTTCNVCATVTPPVTSLAARSQAAAGVTTTPVATHQIPTAMTAVPSVAPTVTYHRDTVNTFLNQGVQATLKATDAPAVTKLTSAAPTAAPTVGDIGTIIVTLLPTTVTVTALPTAAPTAAPVESTPWVNPGGASVTNRPSQPKNLNEWVHKVIPSTPKNMNVPAVAAGAAGGAVVLGGVIAAAVSASQQGGGHVDSPFLHMDDKIDDLKGKVKHFGQEFLGKGGKLPVQIAMPAPAAAAVSGVTAAPVVQPKVMPKTSLTQPVLKGATTLEVASVAGFAIGDTIKIGDEYNMIKGFSSIILDHPMNNAYPADVQVEVVHESGNAAQQGQYVNQVVTPPPPAMKAANGLAMKAIGVATKPVNGTATVANAPADRKVVTTILFVILVGCALCALFACVAFGCAKLFARGSKTRGKDGKYTGISDDDEEEEEHEDGNYRERS